MVTTKDRIIELRQQDPLIQAVRMSELLGISREAIRLSLVKLDMPTNFWKLPTHCLDCGKLLPHNNHSVKRCRSCWSKAHRTSLACDECGVSYDLTLSVAKIRLKSNRHHYCGNRCLGKWLGRTYGFKTKEEAAMKTGGRK